MVSVTGTMRFSARYWDFFIHVNQAEAPYRGSRSHKTGGEAAWLMARGIPKRRSGIE